MSQFNYYIKVCTLYKERLTERIQQMSFVFGSSTKKRRTNIIFVVGNFVFSYIPLVANNQRCFFMFKRISKLANNYRLLVLRHISIFYSVKKNILFSSMVKNVAIITKHFYLFFFI